MNEEAMAQQYLVNYLSADATLSSLSQGGVWLRSVPESAPLPVVKIDRQSASDVMAIKAYRVWADLLFLVRGVVHWRGSGSEDWTDAQAIGDRLDTLLHGYEGQDSTLYVHAFREESYTDETMEGGDVFLHCGGMYRVRAKAL